MPKVKSTKQKKTSEIGKKPASKKRSTSRPVKTAKKGIVKKDTAKKDKAAKLVSQEVISDELIKKPAKKDDKKISRKPRAKPVKVNIIEDEDLLDDETFFSDYDSPEQTSDQAVIKEAEDLFEEVDNNLTEIATQEVDRVTEKVKNMQKESLEFSNVDRQKQFFSDLVSEIKSKRASAIQDEYEDRSEVKRPKKSLNLYRRLVWKFLILVVFLASLVFYLSFSKLTIFITPKVEAMSDNLFLKVLGNENSLTTINDGREKISGSVNELNLEITKTYRTTGEEYIGEEISGKVFLINNYTKDQPLVATTRLLTADNKLYRIKKAVTVPAGGEVEVEIYADKISAEMAIAPTRFTIPGLWAGMQDKIYAESREPFTYKQKVEKYVRVSDVQLANQEASALLLERAKEFKPLRSQDKILYKVIEPVETTLNVKVGDKVEEFSLTTKAKVIAVSFSQEEVSRLAVAKLNILVPDDKELADFKADNLSYSLENYDEETQVATIKTSFSGLMILKSNAEVIERERLVNLNADQISTYLNEYPEIGNYELEFYPSFIKKAPHLVDRIQIKIKK